MKIQWELNVEYRLKFCMHVKYLNKIVLIHENVFKQSYGAMCYEILLSNTNWSEFIIKILELYYFVDFFVVFLKQERRFQPL